MAKTYEQIRAIGTFIKNTTIAKSVTNQMVGENIEDIADKMMSLDNGLKGYFTTIDSLLLAFPNPQIGWTAWVGAAYPGTVYDVVSGAWHNTTVVPPAEEVNLEDYLQKSSIVQGTGYSETDVMSQKAVSSLIKGDDRFIINREGAITFDFNPNTGITTAKIHDSFMILSSDSTTPYVVIPAQEINVPFSYGIILAVYDIPSNEISQTLIGYSINNTSSNILDKNKVYIPIYSYSYINADNCQLPIKSNGQYNILNWQPDWYTYTNTLSGGTALYGTYIPIKCRILGIYCKINSVDSDIIIYNFNINTNKYTLIKTFDKINLSIGTIYLAFDNPITIGGESQIMISGRIGYKNDTNITYRTKTLNYYIGSNLRIVPNYNPLHIAIAYKLENSISTSDLITQLPDSSEDVIVNIGTKFPIEEYTSIFNNIGYVGRYIPSKAKINGLTINVRNIDQPINICLLNIYTNNISIIKTISPTSIGVISVVFDTPIEIDFSNQIVVHGPIGYLYSTNIKEYESGMLLEYNYNGSGDITITPNSLIDFSIQYDLYDNILHKDYVDIAVENIYTQLYSLYKKDSSEDVIVNIGTKFPIEEYTSIFNNIGYVGRYIPSKAKINGLTINVRNIDQPINICLLNIYTNNISIIKTISPTSIGVISVVFDTPIEIDFSNQIVVHGPIGYLYSTNIKEYESGMLLEYNYNGSGDITITPNSLIDFSIQYDLYDNILHKDYVDIAVENIYTQLYSLYKKDSSEDVIVNIGDYSNNLRTLFNNINPSNKMHYTILIPEGTYNVDSWFTDEEKAVEDNSFRGLELPNYVKLLGIGAKEKIILQWINTSATHRGFISTLNTHEWHELENLTVIGENIRYAVHDDLWNGLARYLRVTNCEFIVTDCSRAWGAGHNGGYDGEFVDCKFSVYRKLGNMDAVTYIEPFGLHDNLYSKDDSKVLLYNCRFYNIYTDHPCVNFGMSSNDGITHARIIGCKMNTNVFLGAGSGENEGIINCRVTGFGNIMGVSPAISDNAIKSIDTLIDLI